MNVSITPQQIAKPAGVTPGDWELKVYKDGSQVHYYRGASPSTVFTDVAGGTYTIRASRLDTNGSLIGSFVDRTLEVAGEMVDVPLSIEVS